MSLYEAMRTDILAGHLKPGSKLKIEMLKSRYGTGVNVIRENLVRLSTEGLVASQDQKGFWVVETSKSRLDDLTRMRILLESDGAKHAILNGGVDWESNLVAAHHKLVYIEEKMREDEDAHFAMWSKCDWEFHTALIASCGSELHKHYHKQVYDLFRQYVIVELQTNGFRGTDIIGEHEAILNAALARDIDRCTAALERHLSVYSERFRNA